MPSLSDLNLLPSHISVLQALHSAKSATRVELASRTCLSTQSLTRITKYLIDTGLVREGERLMGARGQPAIQLYLAPAVLVGIGLVLEHDRITCTVRDVNGEELVRLRRRGDFHAPEATLTQSIEMLHSALSQLPTSAVVTGIGISQSGFRYSKDSHALVSRNHPTKWREYDVRAHLAQELGTDVFLENDSLAAAVGLAVQGIGKTYESFYSVLMVKGVAGGFVQNQQLLRGHLGNAGELGILFGTGRKEQTFRPCEESLYGFLREQWGGAPSSEDVELALEQGDDDLETWIGASCETLKSALDAVVALLDPEVIIFTGRLPRTLRKVMADRIELYHPQYAGFSAPPPPILTDPNSRCLETGAASLPLSEFLNGNLV